MEASPAPLTVGVATGIGAAGELTGALPGVTGAEMGTGKAMAMGTAMAIGTATGVARGRTGLDGEVVVAAGDEVAIVAGVGAGDTIDTGVELATMTGAGAGVGIGVAMTGGGGGAIGTTGSGAEVVVITDAEVAMIN